MPGFARRFDERTTLLMAKIKANANESRTRDTLLPKLLSVQVSLRESKEVAHA